MDLAHRRDGKFSFREYMTTEFKERGAFPGNILPTDVDWLLNDIHSDRLLAVEWKRESEAIPDGQRWALEKLSKHPPNVLIARYHDHGLINVERLDGQPAERLTLDDFAEKTNDFLTKFKSEPSPI